MSKQHKARLKRMRRKKYIERKKESLRKLIEKKSTR